MDIEKLEELAKDATPGPWWIDSHGHAMVEQNNFEVVFTHDDSLRPAVRHQSTGNLSHWRNDCDATYIASINPSVLLELIAHIRSIESDRDALHAELLRIKTPKDDEFDVYETFYIDAREWLRPHIEAGKLPQSVIESIQYVIEFWVAAQEAAPVPAMPIPKQEPAGAVPYAFEFYAECDGGWTPQIAPAGMFGLGKTVYDFDYKKIKPLYEHPSPRITEQDAIKPLPYWEPCNPACDNELGQGRDRLCKCKPALDALNKLNANAVAEVRQEPVSQDREMLITLMSAFDTEHSICESCGHQEETMYMDSANMLRDYLQSNQAPAQAAAIPEDDLFGLLGAIENALFRKAAPHAWEYLVTSTGMKFITDRRAALSAAPKPSEK